jgi:hypothetical protein
MMTVTFNDEVSSILNTLAQQSNVPPEKLLTDWIIKTAKVNSIPTSNDDPEAFKLFTAIAQSDKFTLDSAYNAFLS